MFTKKTAVFMAKTLDFHYVLPMAQTENLNLKGSTMTMLTDTDIAHLVTLAGPDFMWADAKGSDRPSNKYPGKGALAGYSPRQGYKAWLIGAQNGVCPHCLNRYLPSMLDVPTLADVCHVVGSGPKRKGFVALNNYAGHSACNTGAARAAYEGESIDGMDERYADSYVDSINARVETVQSGYRQVLGPRDFRDSSLIPRDWPVATMGKFAEFDPARA